MNAVIYARYSSDNQREESIEGQLRECKAYCEKNDIAIVSSYIDRALSAKTDNRPEFQRMIKDSAKGAFGLVVVWKLDRFSRNRYDSARYKHILSKNGIKVVSATEQISNSPEGIILESLLEGMAEYYSAELAVKVRRGLTENALKCKYNGGTLTYGYTIDADRHYQIEPVTAAVVQEIFGRYANGETMRAIRDDLIRRGFTNARGKPIDPNFIPNLLHNRRYIGEYRYCDVAIPGGIPAIVSEELFNRVQAMLAKNRKATARYKATEEYLLSTKLFCGSCGGMMVGETGTGGHNKQAYHYYRCSNSKKRKTCTSTRKTIRKQPIEDFVVQAVMAHITNDSFVQHIADRVMLVQTEESTILPVLRQQLAETERGIDNMLNAIQQGIITESTQRRLQELEDAKKQTELHILQEQLQNPIIPREDITSWIYKFRELNMKSMKARRLLIDSFVNSVILYEDRILIVFNYKDGEEIIKFSDFPGSDMERASPPKSTHFCECFSFAVLQSVLAQFYPQTCVKLSG